MGLFPAALLSLRQEDDLKMRAPVSRPDRFSVLGAASLGRACGKRSQLVGRTRARAGALTWSRARAALNSGPGASLPRSLARARAACGGWWGGAPRGRPPPWRRPA